MGIDRDLQLDNMKRGRVTLENSVINGMSPSNSSSHGSGNPVQEGAERVYNSMGIADPMKIRLEGLVCM